MEIDKNEFSSNGVEFGHYKRLNHPEFAKLGIIHNIRKSVSMMDVDKIYDNACIVYDQIRDLAKSGKNILFVGTEKYISEEMKKSALEARCNFITKKWTPGFLTNFRFVINSQIKKLRRLKEILNSDSLDEKKKKSIIRKQEYEKLNDLYEGVIDLDQIPDCIFIMGINFEKVAVREATKFNIPIISVCDTNFNPKIIDYCIFGNDDGIKSSKFFVKLITKAIKEGKGIEDKQEDSSLEKEQKNI